MGIRIWLDDIRPMPEGFDLWAKNTSYAYNLILTGKVTEISFDNDMGDIRDGYWLANQIEKLAVENKIPPINWNVHSANPAGRKRIEDAMNSADRFWRKNEED
jgi:hypothetical protein